MKKQVNLFAVVMLFVFQANAQTLKNPDYAIQLSGAIDPVKRQLQIYSANRDFCDYYLYITFVYNEGFDVRWPDVAVNTSPGFKKILSYNLTGYSSDCFSQSKFEVYRGSSRKKPDVYFTYALPVKDGNMVTALVKKNPEGYQMEFRTSSDIISACRGGVMCNDTLKDNSGIDYIRLKDDPHLSQITLYHDDGSFGEYIFHGKPLVSPGQVIKVGETIAMTEKQDQNSFRFSVYYLDPRKLRDSKTENKHSYLRPFFQTTNKKPMQLENGKKYQCLYTDKILMQEMSRTERNLFLKKKSK